MMTEQPQLILAGSYLRHIASFLKPSDLPHWLGASGLGLPTLDNEVVSLSSDVFNALLVGAIALSQEPALGLFLGQRLIAATHGFVGYAALSSRTFRDALDVLERFVSVRFSHLTITHEAHGDDDIRLIVALKFSLGEAAGPLLEAVLLSIRNIIDAMSLGDVEVRSLSFPFPTPKYAALARDVARTRVLYDQPWSGLTVSAGSLDLPLKPTAPDLLEQGARICRQRLSELGSGASTAAQVRRLLLEHEQGFPSQTTVAHRLHLTPRTLHRRLKDEGKSFRTLLDEVRFRLARDHLTSGRANLDEIAYVLGYTDPANFRRAFRRWAKMSPSAYRAQHRAH